jgi:small subunit ribosomal protein S6
MAVATPRLYEGLFLVSQALAVETDQAIEAIRGILGRANANIVALRKWDDRKLAYPIDGQKRGTFIIAYFETEPQTLAGIERDCNLSDDVLRSIVTRCDHYGEIERKNAIEGIDLSVDQKKKIEAQSSSDDEDADSDDE